MSCAASDKEHAGDTLDTGALAAGSSEASPSPQGHRESLECQPGAVMRMGINPANRLLSLRSEFTEAGRAQGVSESRLAACALWFGKHTFYSYWYTLLIHQLSACFLERGSLPRESGNLHRKQWPLSETDLSAMWHFLPWSAQVAHLLYHRGLPRLPLTPHQPQEWGGAHHPPFTHLLRDTLIIIPKLEA